MRWTCAVLVAVLASSSASAVDLAAAQDNTLYEDAGGGLSNGGAHPVRLHRLLAEWGEGASDAVAEEGAGVAARAGDATWTHAFFGTVAWARPGGDFVAAPSAAAVVEDEGFYTWGSTPNLVADVQGWLQAPATNHGWALVGDETARATAKRFDSRQHEDEAVRPVLRLGFRRGHATGVASLPWARLKAGRRR